MWRHGCPQKILTTCHQLGLVQSIPTIRNNTDVLSEGSQSRISQWKREVEVIYYIKIPLILKYFLIEYIFPQKILKSFLNGYVKLKELKSIHH